MRPVLFYAKHRRAIEAAFGSCPDTTAVPIVPHVNLHREDWHEARRHAVGASEMGTILGAQGAYGSPFALWWQKYEGWETEQSEEMAMGLDLEDAIANRWRADRPEVHVYRPAAGLYASLSLPYLVCTPDYLTVADHGSGAVLEPLECKAYDGGGGWGRPGTDEVPEHIEIQVVLQCYILGAARGHVARMKRKQVRTYTVEMTEARERRVEEQWAPAARHFLDTIELGQAPPLDGTHATAEALMHLNPDIDETAQVYFARTEVARYRQAVEAAANANRELQLARNEVRAKLGTAKTGVGPDGDAFVERRRYKHPGSSTPPHIVDAIYPKGVTS